MPVIMPALRATIAYGGERVKLVKEGGFSPFFRYPICIKNSRNKWNVIDCLHHCKAHNKAQELTTWTPWFSAWVRYTRILPRITDVSGAAAETQKNLGRLLLCLTRINRGMSFIVPISISTMDS